MRRTRATSRWLPWILGAGVLALAGCGAGGGGTGVGLSPARNILGTWSTPFPVDVYMTSDGCGSLARYNRTPILMTWDITSAGGNEVDIAIYADYIGQTVVIGSHCGVPAILTFPLYLHGVVSSSLLQILEAQMQYDDQGRALGLAYVQIGDFSFTTDNLTGTLYEVDCPINCSGYETDAQECILTR